MPLPAPASLPHAHSLLAARDDAEGGGRHVAEPERFHQEIAACMGVGWEQADAETVSWGSRGGEEAAHGRNRSVCMRAAAAPPAARTHDGVGPAEHEQERDVGREDEVAASLGRLAGDVDEDDLPPLVEKRGGKEA